MHKVTSIPEHDVGIGQLLWRTPEGVDMRGRKRRHRRESLSVVDLVALVAKHPQVADTIRGRGAVVRPGNQGVRLARLDVPHTPAAVMLRVAGTPNLERLRVPVAAADDRGIGAKDGAARSAVPGR